jgi:phospholipid/cholesterol/gamma-HCH transport system substrate-binding protein
VNSLHIVAEGVLVNLSILGDVFIDKGSSFVVKDHDMMGTKSVDIVPGNSGERVQAGEIYNGRSLPGLTDLIPSLNVLSDRFETLLIALEQNDELFKKIDQIITNTDSGIAEIQNLLTNLNTSDIWSAFTEIRNASYSVVNLVNDNTEGLLSTFAKLDTLIIQSTGLISNLHDNVSKEDGNLHRLLNDDELYDNLVRSVKEIETLINDIKQNPRRYFKFSIF